MEKQVRQKTDLLGGALALSVDVGTSSMKAGLIDGEGKLLNWARFPFRIKEKGPLETQPPQQWREALKKILLGFSEKKYINVIAISGNGPTIVPVDAGGAPLEEASLWLNRREIRIPGQVSFFLPRIAWILSHQPGVYQSSRWFLGCPEFLAMDLTGEAAAFTPSTEFAPYIWEEEGIAAYGLDASKLPPLLKTGEILGITGSAAAEKYGLPKGIPVVATGADFLMASLGTGVTKNGRTCDRAGTSEGINCCSSHVIRHERIRCLPHAVEGLYNNAGILASTGSMFEWFRRFSGQQDRDYHSMLSEISKIPWNDDLPRFYPSLHRGAVWEFSRGVFANLEAHHGAAEMGRAVVNSIGFGVRDLIETLESQGCRVESLRISGGQGRSSIWNQMKADITGRTVEVPRIIDAELTGNAAAGFNALGFWDRIEEAAEALVKIDTTYQPDTARYRAYSEEYEEYLSHCNRIIAALAENGKPEA
jgi:xylulokinase